MSIMNHEEFKFPYSVLNFGETILVDCYFLHGLMCTIFRGITCITNRLILYLVLLPIICCGFKFMIDRINKIHEN